MNIERKLQKEGIVVTEKVDTELVLKITNNIAKKISESCPCLNLKPDEIYSKLFVLNMYKANMPEGMAEATYCYENSSIYFNLNIDNEDLEEFAIHECIHFLQEIKDDNNKIVKMGLSDYTKHNPTGIGINEAAVQFISSKIIGIAPDFEKYYDINLYTPSPSYYPVECALINEISYLIGDDYLFKSTFFSSDDFKNEIIKCSSTKTYNKIVTFFDNILHYEEEIIKLNNKLLNSKNTKLSDKIFKLRENVKNTFLESQNLIIHDFFNYEFNKIENLEQLENFRKKLAKFENIIGYVEGYTYYSDFVTEMMNKLEHKSNVLEYGCETSLASKVFSIFDKFRNLISFKKSNKEND